MLFLASACHAHQADQVTFATLLFYFCFVWTEHSASNLDSPEWNFSLFPPSSLPLSPSLFPSSLSLPQARVMYDFEGDTENGELVIKEGDEVVILDQVWPCFILPIFLFLYSHSPLPPGHTSLSLSLSLITASYIPQPLSVHMFLPSLSSCHTYGLVFILHPFWMYSGTSDKGPSEIGTTSLQKTLVSTPC